MTCGVARRRFAELLCFTAQHVYNMCSLLISTDQLMFVLANLCYRFTFVLQTSFFTIVLKQSDQSKDTDNPLNKSTNQSSKHMYMYMTVLILFHKKMMFKVVKIGLLLQWNLVNLNTKQATKIWLY